MMIIHNKKGGSDFLRSGIIFFITLFIFIGIIASFGFGDFITVETPEQPQPLEPSGNWILDALTYVGNNLTYFFGLLGMSIDFGIFTSLIFVPFLILVTMFILETIRGH